MVRGSPDSRLRDSIPPQHGLHQLVNLLELLGQQLPDHGPEAANGPDLAGAFPVEPLLYPVGAMVAQSRQLQMRGIGPVELWYGRFQDLCADAPRPPTLAAIHPVESTPP
jgi:hypothetical protein